MKLELDRKILLDALRRVSFVGAPATRLDSDGEKLVATAAVSTCAARATVYLKPNAKADAKLGDSVATNGSGNRDRAEARAGSRAVAAATAAVSTCAARATVCLKPNANVDAKLGGSVATNGRWIGVAK